MNGVFNLNNVPHGEYVLSAGSREYLELVGQTGTTNLPPTSFESGLTSLAVAGDIAGIEFRLSRGFEIRGRLLIDGSLPVIDADQRLMINATAVMQGGPLHGRAAIVQASGEFVLTSFAGRMRVSAIGLPRGAVIARVSLNGIDVTDEGFDVSGPIAGLEVAVTTRPAVVRGTVSLPSGEPALGGSVIVFSDDARLWTLPNTRYVRMSGVSLKSDYSVAGLPSGRYFAVALAWLESKTWADPLNLAELRKVATPFTVPESGHVTLNLVFR